MKTITLVLSLSITLFAHAHQDFLPGPENSPNEAELAQNRECFQEMDRLGCSHPREDRDYFVVCYRSNRRLVTEGCQALFDTLYGTN
jgi:hypothetical protein